MLRLTLIPSLMSSLLFLFGVGSAVAEEIVRQHNVEIKRLGSHRGNVFYISTSKPFEKPCKYGLAYCFHDDKSCNNMLSVALTAKS